MVAHYILHTINTNDGDIVQMVPWTCVCVCIMTIIEWFYQSIYTLMEWFNYSISMPLYCQYLSHPIEIDKGDCEFYCWIIEITNNVMNAGGKCVFSLRKSAPHICNIIGPKGWLQNLNLSLLQNALSGTACAHRRQSIAVIV